MTGKGPVGRPESAIDPSLPFAELADRLRLLKQGAKLNIRQLADLTDYSQSTLSEAANGKSLPNLDVMLAYVRACGGNLRQWAERWQEAALTQRIARAGGEEPADPDFRPEHAPDWSAPSSDLVSIWPSTGEVDGNTSISCRATTASGQSVRVPMGGRLVFGRGPDVDLSIAAGRGLSRRAGMITVGSLGAWIANISRTHALYAEGEGYRIRLPRLEDGGEPCGGWLLHAGTALIGSRAMLDEGLPLAVTVTGQRASDGVSGENQSDGEGTILPLYLDPMTKLFLIALIWCRPWLLDPSATTPLPRTPEIARSALEVTGAYHELERFETDAEFRDLLSARVAEHIKVLRRKLSDRGLAGADVRLSDEVAVRILIEHGVITTADLGYLADPAWRSRQEDLWWTQS